MIITNDSLSEINLKVNELGFGKPISDDVSVRYSLYISFENIEVRFSEYFNDFMEREADDPEPDEYLNGVYLKIKIAGFPKLKYILDDYFELFCELVTKELSAEFLGYVLVSGEKNDENNVFVIQSLDCLKNSKQGVLCEGIGYYRKKNIQAR